MIQYSTANYDEVDRYVRGTMMEIVEVARQEDILLRAWQQQQQQQQSVDPRLGRVQINYTESETNNIRRHDNAVYNGSW